MRRVLLVLALVLAVGCGKRSRATHVADVRLPAETPEFRFGPGDRLAIQVYKHEDLDGELLVAPDGSVTLPLLGRIEVAGQTYTEVVSTLEGGLRKYYTDASVAVNVTEVSNRKVFVVGEVAQPQVLQITGEMRVLEALVRAGGINSQAKTRNILLVRGTVEKPELYKVDVNKLLVGDLAQNASLQAGDILVVPTKTIVDAERFFRSVQGILSPFVSASQVYRNISAPGSVLFDDNTNPQPQQQ